MEAASAPTALAAADAGGSPAESAAPMTQRHGRGRDIIVASGIKAP
jgi:hypothetical protein